MPEKKHVLILTFPAFGHLIPALELARKVAKYHNVTFAASESKVVELKQKELLDGDETSDGFKVYAIKDEVLGDFESPEAFAKVVFSGVLPAVRELIQNIPRPDGTGDQSLMKPVDVVIGEIFLADPLQKCREREIPFYVFDSSAAWITRYFGAITDESPVVPHDDLQQFHTKPLLGGPPIPVSDFFLMFFGPIRKIWPYTVGMVHNTFEAIDAEELDILRNDHTDTKHVPHYAVGPLIPDKEGKTSESNRMLTDKVKSWMERKDPHSVVYVSFGSVATPAPEQIAQIAEGLLQLNKPFIWSLRENKHNQLPDEMLSRIPTQFDDPDGRFLILPWAPQKEILADPATAAIVSHGGWNGILESVSNGVPVVCWPMFADQLVNGEWIVEAGMGQLVRGTGMMKADRVVPAMEIADIVATVAGFKSNGTGNLYFEAAQVWKKKVETAVGPGGSSYQDVARLCEFKEIKSGH